ncbi:MAG: hypothetical protein CL920_17500 [Deltaproteobacteria bacterium]|nr:hypothetical protein [Deltaproteobacteria bacterium]
MITMGESKTMEQSLIAPQRSRPYAFLGWVFSCLLMLSLPNESIAQNAYQDSCTTATNCGQLVCTGTQQAAGYCVLSCNQLQPICPNDTPCKVLPSGGSGCFCTSDSDCPTTGTCLDGQCNGKGKEGESCTAATGCESGLICSQVNNQTEFRCWRLCSGQTCDGGAACMLLGTFSVCQCSSNAQCQSGLCQNGLCVNKRTLGQTCSSEQVCEDDLACVKLDDGTSSCLPKCNGTSCLGGETCTSLSNGQKACVCSAKNPCPVGLQCTKGYCDIGTRCLTKSTPSGCADKQTCYTPISGSTRGQCVQTCSSTSDKSCPTGMKCKAFTSGGFGCYCKTDSDCESGRKCIAQQCSAACEKDSDCSNNQTCQSGTCQSTSSEVVINPPSEQSTEQTKDAGPGKEPTPTCEPACASNQKCVNAVCEKLDFLDPCEVDTDCKSGFCFGPGASKICSTSDCSACISVTTCQTIDGKQGCFIGSNNPTPTPTDKGACGCQSASAEPSIWVLLLFVVIAFVRRRRALQSHSS